jgi:hypothetical protein
MFDFNKARQAWMKTIPEYQPDKTSGAAGTVKPGRVLEILGSNEFRLPGRGILRRSVIRQLIRSSALRKNFTIRLLRIR